MILRILTALLLTVVVCPSQFSPAQSFRQTVAAPAGGGGEAADETFDPTGYDLTWTEGGTATPDEDYSASPINGAQSLRIVLSSQTGFSENSFTAASTKTVVLRWRRTDNTGTAIVFAFYNDTGLQSQVRVFDGGTLDVAAGGTASAQTVAGISDGAEVYIRYTYTKGTGANAVGSVEWSTTSTFTGSGNNFTSTSAGTSTLDANKFRIGTGASEVLDWVFDDVDYQ